LQDIPFFSEQIQRASGCYAYVNSLQIVCNIYSVFSMLSISKFPTNHLQYFHDNGVTITAVPSTFNRPTRVARPQKLELYFLARVLENLRK